MSARSPDQAWFEKAEQDLEMARRAMDSAGRVAGDGMLSLPAMCRKVLERIPDFAF